MFVAFCCEPKDSEPTSSVLALKLFDRDEGVVYCLQDETKMKSYW